MQRQANSGLCPGRVNSQAGTRNKSKWLYQWVSSFLFMGALYIFFLIIEDPEDLLFKWAMSADIYHIKN